MAEAYTRLIEIKVKDTDLGRALNKLQNSLEKIEKKLDVIAGKKAGKGFDAVAKGAEKAAKATKLWDQTLKNTGKHFKAFDILGQGINKASSNILKFGKRALALDVTARSVKKLTEVFWQHSKSIDGAWKSLQKLEQASRNFIQTNNKLIQTLASVGVPLLAIGQYAPQIYNLGKAFRQLEYDVKRLDKIGRSKGFRAAVGEVIPKGNQSHLLGRVSKWAHAEQPKPVETLTGQTSPVTGFAELGSLDTRRKALANTKQIQEKLVALTGKHLQASIQVRKAMIGYNLELAKTKVVQGFVTADLWAMQKAWQGIVSTIKGAGNLVGGLFGGKFGGVGQAAGVIGLSRGIEALTGKLGFLNKAWIENINTFSKWTARGTEAITAINIAYTGLNKVLGAAQWTAGAITGFIKWEEQAMLSIRRINRARDNLDKRMAGLLDKGQNPFTGIRKWLRGESGERGVKAQLADKGESNQQRIAREIEVQQRLLKATNTTAKDYLQIQKEIIRLQKQQTIEVNKRRMMEVRAGKNIKEVYKDEIQAVEDRRSAKEASIRKERAKRAKFNKQVLQSELKEIANKKKAELDAIEKVRQAEIRAAKDAANAQERKRQARRDAMGRFGENVMLGAGFPMLFGGGPGAVAGGLTGAIGQSALGSKGFGMQIFFSAIGQQIDAFAGKAMELGKALKDPTEALSMLSTMGIKVEESFSDHIKALVDLGRTHEAQALVNKEVAKIIGKDGVKALKDLGVANAELMDKANKLRIKIMSDLAPAFEVLIGMASRFVDSVGGNNIRQRAKDLDIKAYQSAHNRIEKEIVKEFGFWATDESKAEYWRRMTEASKGIIRDKQPGWLGETANSKSGSGGIGSGVTQSDAVWEHTVAKSFNPLQEKRQELERILELGTEEAGIQQQIAEIVKEQGFTIGTINPKLLEKIDNEVRSLNALEDQVEAAQKLTDMYKKIGETIKDGMVNAIEGAIEGTKTLGEVASSVFRSIARMMLQYGVQSFMTSMFPGSKLFGQLASGGPAKAGKTYLVGEKGPELFTPTSSGHVTPNHELGGSNIVVNVDASGSAVEGDDQNAQQLGEMLAAAIQSELIKQQRPGGLLR